MMHFYANSTISQRHDSCSAGEYSSLTGIREFIFGIFVIFAFFREKGRE